MNEAAKEATSKAKKRAGDPAYHANEAANEATSKAKKRAENLAYRANEAANCQGGREQGKKEGRESGLPSQRGLQDGTNTNNEESNYYH